jgi:hypothetical protein
MPYRVSMTPSAFGNQSGSPGIADRLGLQVVVDFFEWALAAGMGYQVRAGTITTPLTGDVLITDTAAEFCADAASGLTIIPCYFEVDIEALGGTLPQVTAKAAPAISTAGAAFVPLPLLTGGPAAASTARVAAAGGVTVAAELNTTTRVLYERTLAVGASLKAERDFHPKPRLAGPACIYIQVGSVTTGSDYFGHLDYIEGLTSQLT